MKAAGKPPIWIEMLQEWVDINAVALYYHLECFHNFFINPVISLFKTDGYPHLFASVY
jgi:hypothetical protein